jgi:hypothetical protein
VGNSRLSLSTYLHIIFQFLDLAVCLCTHCVCLRCYCYCIPLRSCVLNPNVRVESRSRYHPNDSPCRHCKTHMRNDTLEREKSHCGLYLAATVHFLWPPCMLKSPVHSYCFLDDQFRRPTSAGLNHKLTILLFYCCCLF